MAESTPPEESMPRNRLSEAILFPKYHLRIFFYPKVEKKSALFKKTYLGSSDIILEDSGGHFVTFSLGGRRC